MMIAKTVTNVDVSDNDDDATTTTTIQTTTSTKTTLATTTTPTNVSNVDDVWVTVTCEIQSPQFKCPNLMPNWPEMSGNGQTFLSPLLPYSANGSPSLKAQGLGGGLPG